jgi:hypothetical protein
MHIKLSWGNLKKKIQFIKSTVSLEDNINMRIKGEGVDWINTARNNVS